MADLRRVRRGARHTGAVTVAADPEVTPLQRFLGWEAGAAALLLAGTVLALVWANSPWGDSYETFWHTELAVRLGDEELSLTCSTGSTTA